MLEGDFDGSGYGFFYMPYQALAGVAPQDLGQDKTFFRHGGAIPFFGSSLFAG